MGDGEELVEIGFFVVSRGCGCGDVSIVGLLTGLEVLLKNEDQRGSYGKLVHSGCSNNSLH